MISCIHNLHPEIRQYFDRKLLSKPCPKLYDDSSFLWSIYQYIVLKLKKKCNNHPNRLTHFQKLEYQFLELYERAKAKEKELKEETGYAGKGPFYFISETSECHPYLFARLRGKSYKFK